MNLQLLTLAVGAYAAVVAYLGWLGYRKTQSAADYLVGGREIHPVLMGLAYGSTFISTSALVGFAGVAALMGMGLRRLSMSPAFVPTIKEVVRCSTLEDAEAVARRVLHLKTFRQVRRYLSRVTEQICPNIAAMDTKK